MAYVLSHGGIGDLHNELSALTLPCWFVQEEIIYEAVLDFSVFVNLMKVLSSSRANFTRCPTRTSKLPYEQR